MCVGGARDEGRARGGVGGMHANYVLWGEGSNVLYPN